MNYSTDTIVVIVPSLKDKGPTRQILYFIDFLLKTNNYHIIICSISSVYGDISFDFFNTRSISIHNPFQLLNILRRVNTKTMVFISQGIVADIFNLVLKPFGSHTVSFSRNNPLIDYPHKFNSFFGNLLARLHLFVFKRFDKVISVSEYIHSEMIKHKIDSFCICNGINVLSIQPKHSIISFPKEKVSLFTSGSLIYRKNVFTLLKGLSLTLDANPYYRTRLALDVFGEGNLEKYIFKASNDSNLPVFFHGFDARYSYKISCYDIFVSCSFSEGMPNSVLEALSAGLPCILSDIEPHRQLKALFPEFIFLYGAPSDYQSLSSVILDIISTNRRFEPQELRELVFKNLDSSVTSAKILNLLVK